MQPHDRLRETIARCGSSGRPAIVAFLTAGFPHRENFRTQLADITGEADAVEIGVPFTDPMADGLTIQRSSRRALEAGVRLPWILAELEAMDTPPAAPLLLMSYLNPLLAFGFEALAQHAARVDICALIVPDLPYEESESLRAAVDAQGIGLVQLVTPATPPERLAMLCHASRGFVYAVTSAGTTGGGRGLPADVTTYLDRVRAVSPLPVCAGFGIRSANQVTALAPHADGIIVGSALVEVLEAGGDPVAFLRSLRRQTATPCPPGSSRAEGATPRDCVRHQTATPSPPGRGQEEG